MYEQHIHPCVYIYTYANVSIHIFRLKGKSIHTLTNIHRHMNVYMYIPVLRGKSYFFLNIT